MSTTTRRKNKSSASQDEPVQTPKKFSTRKASSTKAPAALWKAAKDKVICCLGVSWWQCLFSWSLILLTGYTVRPQSPQTQDSVESIAITNLTACVYAQLFYVRSKISARDWIRPGRELWAEGLRPKHPVVVVPGKCLLQLEDSFDKCTSVITIQICRFCDVWTGAMAWPQMCRRLFQVT